MKICLLGDFSSNCDEGYKNISHYLADQLGEQNKIVRINIKQPNWFLAGRYLLSEDLDIFHVLAQPTLGSLMVSRMIKIPRGRIGIVVSGLKTHSFINNSGDRLLFRYLSRLLKPDLFLVQSKEAQKYFCALDWNVKWLSNGVNWRRFYPVTDAERKKLKVHYGFTTSKPIVLHVGHLQLNRNLLLLEELSNKKYQIVIIGSTYLGIDQRLTTELKKRGWIYYAGYQPNIVDFFRLADCYVFPVKPGNSLDTPLSVLEAMACNLPVVTTRFSGLDALFCEGNGFYFADNSEQFCFQVMHALNSDTKLATRDMVLQYSWSAICDQLQHYYQEML
jgi:glycosyltransferase involved in cell wall biosynthesis